MIQVFRIFFRAEGTRPILVLLSLLLAALFEAVGLSTLVPAVSIVAGDGPAAATQGLGQTINQAFAMVGLTPTLGNLILLITGALVLKSAISFVALTYAGIAASKVSVLLRHKLIDALFGASWKFYSSQHSGAFANAVSNDATRAGEAYVLAAQFVALSVQAVLYALIAIFMDWRLALMGVAVGGGMIAVLNTLIRISRQAGYKQTDRTNLLTVNVVDLLANIKPLKTMHRYGPAQAALRDTMRRLQRNLITRELSKQGLIQGGDAFTAVAIGGVVYVAHTFWQVPLAELLVGGVIFLKVIQNATRLQRMLQLSVQVESAYERLTQLISLSEANREVRPGTAEPDTRADCKFIDVSFAHEKTPVLKNVSLVIPARGITVLKGPSGAGKTTIVDLFIGLHEPTSGQIHLGKTPLSDIDVVKLRRRIGYVPQELSLLHSTIRENITLGDTSISDDRVRQAMDLAGAGTFIANLPDGLDTDVGETGGKLSGGQRQRISLARALVTEPDILILDEVTSA
ncbi:MAG: ABC transporter ATP-binding protein, partial [Acidimicrobiales bacterium]|nr:ABC transporter ATP-binding protein [Acidimicrobiales bacterium]